MNAAIDCRLEGVIAPEQQLTYIHVPFDVPPGIGRIDVRYRYDAPIGSDPTLTGGNTLDIGIFDARGIGFSSPGYRGWSGSARPSFFIGQDIATPGYQPGAIQAGTWHICLGAYKVARGGCHYQIEIALTPTHDSRPHFPPALRLNDTPTTRRRMDGWYRGDLHCHTVHSDGDSTPEDLVRHAEALGLDFLAITDHNNRTAGIDLRRVQTDLMLIPGYEVTTYHGHWNVWGHGAWIDFRTETPVDLARSLGLAQSEGYLTSCNHPRPYGPDWEYRDVEGFNCVEVWNGPWELLNSICLAFWEAKLRAGQRLVAVGGSDHHVSRQPHIARLAHPTTFIYCPDSPSAAGLLKALRAGHAFISEAPDGPKLMLKANGAMMGDTLPRPQHKLRLQVRAEGAPQDRLEFIGRDGILAHIELPNATFADEIKLPLSDATYVRAQIVSRDDGRIRALTNPIYLT